MPYIAILIGVLLSSSVSANETAPVDVPKKTITDCLRMWKMRLKGYTPKSDKYEIENRDEKLILKMPGKVIGNEGHKEDYTFYCRLDNDLKLDRTITYFSIRLDEQIRMTKDPKGIFGNPVLPKQSGVKPHGLH